MKFLSNDEIIKFVNNFKNINACIIDKNYGNSQIGS